MVGPKCAIAPDTDRGVGWGEHAQSHKGVMMRKRIIGGLIMGAVVGASVLMITASAGAEFPGQNGRITFMRTDAQGFWQTWVANADLSGQVQLTNESANSMDPVWSPDGTRLAFDSDRADPYPGYDDAFSDIFTMNPDGTGLFKVTDSVGFSGDPGWSPDGSQIAFEADRGDYPAEQGIYVADADGSNLHRVTTLPPKFEIDLAPRFSPDGTQLVFTRYRGFRPLKSGKNSAENGAVFTVGVDGSGLRRLTPWGNSANDADWSPDGTQIVFEAYPGNSFGDVYIVDADGKHLTNITHNHRQAGSADPVWSPDGTKILFLQARVENGEFNEGLATMNPDGTARGFLSATPMVEHQPDWESIP
jgi:TolB protein